MNANIFISFASQDRKVAMTLCSALESRGFRCWISARDIQPGENFQSAIVRAIRQAKIMLLVFTSNSNNSEEMNKELALASQSKLIVVPLRIEDVTPNDAFAYEFATRQWIDFFADWEFAIQQLALRIGAALGEAADGAPEASAAEPAAEHAFEPAPQAPEAAATPQAESVEAAEPPPAPAPVLAAAPEPVPSRSPAAELDAEEVTAPRSRASLYLALSAAAAVALAAGLILPGVLKSKPAPAQPPRIMAAVPTAAPPAGVQRVAIEVGATGAAPTAGVAAGPANALPPQPEAAPAGADDAPVVDKPAPRRKKTAAVVHAARTSDNYVPY